MSTVLPNAADELLERQKANTQAKMSWRQSKKASSLMRAFGFGAGIYASTDGPPREIESFTCNAPISLPDILAYLPPGSHILGSKELPQYIPQAIRECQAATAARLGVPRDDICWFLQFPQRIATGVPLSHSASVASIECRVALMIFGEALALEAALLLEQHAALVEECPVAPSSTDNSSPEKSRDEDEVDPEYIQELPPPDPEVCNRPSVRVGVNETCTLIEAAEGIMLPILRGYRDKVPRRAWRSVCHKGLRKAWNAFTAMEQEAEEEDEEESSSMSASSTANHAHPKPTGQMQDGGKSGVSAFDSSGFTMSGSEIPPPYDPYDEEWSLWGEFDIIRNTSLVLGGLVWNELQADSEDVVRHAGSDNAFRTLPCRFDRGRM